jgi:hypothetical protein
MHARKEAVTILGKLHLADRTQVALYVLRKEQASPNST